MQKLSATVVCNGISSIKSPPTCNFYLFSFCLFVFRPLHRYILCIRVYSGYRGQVDTTCGNRYFIQTRNLNFSDPSINPWPWTNDAVTCSQLISRLGYGLPSLRCILTAIPILSTLGSMMRDASWSRLSSCTNCVDVLLFCACCAVFIKHLKLPTLKL